MGSDSRSIPAEWVEDSPPLTAAQSEIAIKSPHRSSTGYSPTGFQRGPGLPFALSSPSNHIPFHKITANSRLARKPPFGTFPCALSLNCDPISMRHWTGEYASKDLATGCSQIKQGSVDSQDGLVRWKLVGAIPWRMVDPFTRMARIWTALVSIRMADFYWRYRAAGSRSRRRERVECWKPARSVGKATKFRTKCLFVRTRDT
jgi:hypothetical protein